MVVSIAMEEEDTAEDLKWHNHANEHRQNILFPNFTYLNRHLFSIHCMFKRFFDEPEVCFIDPLIGARH